MKLRQVRSAFTLIELLVVVAIIALLIAILLPSLGQAKRLAKAAACAANVRSICQGANVYAQQWDGAIPGNAYTSSAALYNPITMTPIGGQANSVTNIVSTFDWMCPIATAMGLTFNAGPLATDRLDRFQTVVNMKAFHCPANDFLATPYPMSFPSYTGPETSYTAAVLFQYASGTSGVKYETYTIDEVLPIYRPNINKVGNLTSKVFIADGAKYSTTATPPQVNLTYADLDFYSAFTDDGAYNVYSHSWDRGLSPGNGNHFGGTADARFYAYRHGGGTKGGPAGSFKMNVGFFDGHVDLMNDADSANPAIWAPSGATIPASAANSVPQPDVLAKYFGGQSSYLVP